jgi:hypothetical protein
MVLAILSIRDFFSSTRRSERKVLSFDIREPLVLTLAQLCSNFGVKQSCGALLRVSLSHPDLADLVGASRPRVTEHSAELEREHLLKHRLMPWMQEWITPYPRPFVLGRHCSRCRSWRRRARTTNLSRTLRVVPWTYRRG